MTERTASSVVAIIPCNDVDAAELWWNRLGFRRPPEQDWGDYRMLADEAGAEVHLQRGVEGWVVPGCNPFGVYVYTPRVDSIAAAVPECVIERGGPEVKHWGMYEVSLNGPDDLLVRVGWPVGQVAE